ncbi:substrate-binding periplasmic protein [Chitinilyticum piscinae]|uniref:Transporter substrate-binding domain-containing protein n=1 Tax=Chitinilyticum piscinae TaxID=2866724 RepID=A0A8J7FMW5_9NEIS|nr:transporter substrate-binding domain-containing protein [Chitinilyticum piscinae]MBE9609089.1 transporter substrate-binding domain-containing protein [Chitinilyticum piscinae]
MGRMWWWLPGWLLAAQALAACSRPIVVPATSSGKLVSVSGQQLGGIYPDLLRESSVASGCVFRFEPVPWARMMYMLETGTGDLFAPLSQTAERDRYAELVPMYYSTPVVITLLQVPALTRAEELLNYPELRVNVVRGHNWGPAYASLVERLRAAGMVEEVTDMPMLLKKMAAGRAHVAIMGSHLMDGAIQTAGMRDTLAPRLRYQQVRDLDTNLAGVYLSKSLPEGDRVQLRAMLQHWLKSGLFWLRLQREMTAQGLSSLAPLPQR